MSRRLCSEDCPLAQGGAEAASVGTKCAAYMRVKEAMTKYFKFYDFRSGQLDALLPSLHGKDVFVRMATGAGKTLCIFLVPLASGDQYVEVVISPLIALVNQQVLHFSIITCSRVLNQYI